jgi:hypothetical protein
MWLASMGKNGCRLAPAGPDPGDREGGSRLITRRMRSTKPGLSDREVSAAGRAGGGASEMGRNADQVTGAGPAGAGPAAEPNRPVDGAAECP